MDDATQILLSEYAQVRDSERSSRNLLVRINTLAVGVVSGLLIAITQYNVEVLALVGPLIFYFVGFFYSAEALRLLRLVEHARRLERQLRAENRSLAAGLEDAAHPGAGLLFLLRYNAGIVIAPALFYGIFYLLFFYFLAESGYPGPLKLALIAAYLLIGGILWFHDLWTNRHYLLRKESTSAS
ncbi:MAG: hypothetical protein HY706_21945 [Candidatus Hydrogenedentes bacterium]|nr:hypothetical protein [Candidatus Hydrogenedentota bacterium]